MLPLNILKNKSLVNAFAKCGQKVYRFTYHLLVIHDIDLVERVSLQLLVLVSFLDHFNVHAELVDILHAQDENDEQSQLVRKGRVLTSS